jgi:signal transduction histidine kinase
MVNDLLDLSRMEAEMDNIQQCLLNLSAITSEVYETFKIRAENAEVKLICNIEPNLPSVMGDDDQIRRVFYNLLENAINHTPRGGKIVMTLGNSPKNGAVRITVQDNGQGIAPEHLPHVFERFYRVEATSTGITRGSGLGLSIAKSIIEAHGGEIGVESELKSGTNFWADLPAAK